MDHPLPNGNVDPELLAWDQNYKAGNNLDLIESSGAEAGVWQETQFQADPYTMPEPDSEPLERYTNSMTGQFSNDWPPSDVDTLMYTGEESPTFPPPSINSPEAQKENLLENPTFQGFLDTARGTPQSPSPGVENAPQSSNAKGDGPLTLDHPVIGGYLELAPHLQHIIEYILNAEWYKKRRQEPPGNELPVELSLKTRQSSSTPMSLFGEFFAARQPYDCLLCPDDSPKHRHKRTLERALGHSREHFNFKPIGGNQKLYTNLNTKNDQERRALNPAKFCIPCRYKKITVQNCQRHIQSKAHKNLAASYPGDVWSNTPQQDVKISAGVPSVL